MNTLSFQHMPKVTLFILVLFLFPEMSRINAQSEALRQDSIYQSNIKKTRLYGVYIPKDIPDALSELDRLSTPEAKAHLKKADEKTIGKKLRFGLGRWMEYNWNLQEGSRISHLLRNMGLWHPDDMVEYLIILYYRHTNGKPLDSEILAKNLAEQRAKWLKLQQNKNTVEILDEDE